jgi:hypothetical protein
LIFATILTWVRNNFIPLRKCSNGDRSTLNGVVYNLSHLDAHQAEYYDEKYALTYKFIVTYSCHCFTESPNKSTNQDSSQLTYTAPHESRLFNFERYHLSKQLPNIIRVLAEQETLVFHADYSNYATAKPLNSQGSEVDYFVVFTVFKEAKKLRLHVLSAYPKTEGIGRVQKVQFLFIANNLLRNKKLPQPR